MSGIIGHSHRAPIACAGSVTPRAIHPGRADGRSFIGENLDHAFARITSCALGVTELRTDFDHEVSARAEINSGLIFLVEKTAPIRRVNSQLHAHQAGDGDTSRSVGKPSLKSIVLSHLVCMDGR